MVHGRGVPSGQAYQDSIAILYALTFTIKMSKMGANKPQGYFEYVVPPLEGLWWCEEGQFELDKPEKWCWISMLRQPEFVSPKIFQWAVEECKEKKPELIVDLASV